MLHLFFKKNHPAPQELSIPMPYSYRIFMWVITFIIIGVTAWVWILAWQFRLIINSGVWVPGTQFAFIFLGYHILMMLVSFVGWGMQTFWHSDEVMAFFPLALGMSTAILIFAAWQLSLVVGMAGMT